MVTAQKQSHQQVAEKLDDDSAVTLLRQLEEERGKMFDEAEYQEVRRTVLDEIAHGARLRPFTIFTFAVILFGLVALLAVGLVTASGRAMGDHLLAMASGGAMMAAGYFFWSCVSGVRLDAQRSLDDRLNELEKLREQRLISTEEHDQIQACILIARQRSTVRRQ